MSENLLQAIVLSVNRGDEPLFKNISFNVERGSLLQLHGDNGSGKTTLLRTLCTLIPLDTGELRWRGEKLPGARDKYFSEMCFAGHIDGLKGDLTAVENLQCNLTGQMTSAKSCLDALARTGLSGREYLPCRVLSAGQRRRVVLARVLLSKAALWILDEPLTALDTDGRVLVESIMEEHLEGGGSAIFSTHQPLSLAGRNIQSVALS